MENNILIIDDEQSICISLTFALENNYNVTSAANIDEGMKLIREGRVDLCLLDLKIGEYDGIEVLKEIKKTDGSIAVVMMTAYGSINSSVDAMKNGAYTYLTKPLDIEELYLVVEQALEYRQLNKKVEYLSRELENKYVSNGIIGRSASMKNVFKLIDKLKNVDTSVLITGESGTGKELVARAIHFSGKRKKERFEEVNCAAIPDGLLEEELFGHKRGSFTGAIDNKQGKLEFANNGTVFLDEIGDMPFSLQAKLLRVLQQKEYSPIGSNEKKQVNIRVIAATNKDLKALVEEGKFRPDLYFRLNVIEINLPPLREKKQDLPLLFDHFIQQYNRELNKNIKAISKEAEKKLLGYNYPGNIRELSNIVEYAMVLCDEDIIEVKDLPKEVRYYEESAAAEDDKAMESLDSIVLKNLTGITLKEIEKRVIKANLIKNGGHRKATANTLGISERGLRNKIEEYHIV